jgi:hypothetical protein
LRSSTKTGSQRLQLKMYDRLAHRVGRSSQATPAAVDKSQRLEHKNSDSPGKALCVVRVPCPGYGRSSSLTSLRRVPCRPDRPPVVRRVDAPPVNSQGLRVATAARNSFPLDPGGQIKNVCMLEGIPTRSSARRFPPAPLQNIARSRWMSCRQIVSRVFGISLNQNYSQRNNNSDENA